MTVATATAVLVDSREPPSVRALTFGGAPVATQTLTAGDVHVLTSDGALLAVERKTPDDLVASVLDGRLFAQIGALRQLTPWTYLVVDGVAFRGRRGQVIHSSRDSGFAWNALQGALLSVMELGAGVLHLGDGEFEDGVLQLVRRQRGPVRPARRVLAPDDPALTVLTSLPGIGYDRALAVLRACGSVAAGLWALTELAPGAWSNSAEGRAALGGVGPARKALVRGALGLEAGYCLQVIREEAPDDAAPAPSKDRPTDTAPDPAQEESDDDPVRAPA